MMESWIPLACQECGEEWEGTPASLPAPGHEFECPYCEASYPVAEFVKTNEGFKILRSFHK